MIEWWSNVPLAPQSPAPSEDSADRKAAEVTRSPDLAAERSPLRAPDSEARLYDPLYRRSEGHRLWWRTLHHGAGSDEIADALRKAFEAGYNARRVP